MDAAALDEKQARRTEALEAVDAAIDAGKHVQARRDLEALEASAAAEAEAVPDPEASGADGPPTLDSLRKRLNEADPVGAAGIRPLASMAGDLPRPVLWMDSRRGGGTVLRAGDVAALGGAGGVGKSFATLALAVAAAEPGDGPGDAVGLHVRRGPAVLIGYEDDPAPDRAEMNRAAEETLKALGLERHQALIVAHRDKDHPHLHMIANRVNPETGKAAKLGNDRLKLSRWAERWERERGQVKCPERAKNNAERAKGGRFVRDRKSLHTARHRRERMRKAGPVREVGPRVRLHKPAHLEKWASMEREAFRQYQQARGPVLEALARDCRQAWRRQYEEQKADAAAVEKLAGGDVRDRLRLARIAGDGDWRRIRQERDRRRRGGFGRKLRGAWKEARALGVRAAVGAVRSDPAELKRLAMAKLERGHWRARARIGQHHTYEAVAAETEAGHVYGQATGEVHRAALGMQAVERQEREAARPPPPQRMPDRGPSRDRGGGWER